MKRLSMFLVVIIAGVLGLALPGCASGNKTGVVDGPRAHELVKQGAFLLDVRTPREFSAGHIDGATNIPLSLLAEKASKLDKTKPIVVYCQSGARSRSATSTLSSMGFTVYDLGGMYNW